MYCNGAGSLLPAATAWNDERQDGDMYFFCGGYGHSGIYNAVFKREHGRTALRFASLGPEPLHLSMLARQTTGDLAPEEHPHPDSSRPG